MQLSRTEKGSLTTLALSSIVALSVGIYEELKEREIPQAEPILEQIYIPQANPELVLPLNVKVSAQKSEENKTRVLTENNPKVSKKDIDTAARIAYAEARSEGYEGMLAVISSINRRFELDSYFDSEFAGERLFSDPEKEVTLEAITSYEVNGTPQYNALRDDKLLTTTREELEPEAIDLAYQITLDVLSGSKNPYSKITHFKNSEEDWNGRTIGWIDNSDSTIRCENTTGPDAGIHQTYSTSCEKYVKGQGWKELRI